MPLFPPPEIKPVPITSGGTNATDAGTARTNLGLAIDTNVQGYDADLTTWAGVTPGAGVAAALAIANNSAGGYSPIDGTATLTNKSIAATQLTGGLNSAQMAAVANNANAIVPVTYYVKNLAVLTSGTPADIGTISIPASITRWRLMGTATTTTPITLVQETLGGGTNAAATFMLYPTSGGGTAINSGTPAGQATASPTWLGIAATAVTTLQTSNTIYVRQTANSANAGTVSFYVRIEPLP